MGDLSTTRTLEEVYFHVSDGGLKFRVVEETKVTEPERVLEHGLSDNVYRNYRLEYSLSNFGAGVDGSFPIGSGEIARWLSLALMKVAPLVDYQAATHSWSPFESKGDVSISGGEAVETPKAPVQEDSMSASKTAHRVVQRYLRACAGGCSCGGQCGGSCGGRPQAEQVLHPLDEVSITAMRVADAFQAQVLGPHVTEDPNTPSR